MKEAVDLVAGSLFSGVGGFDKALEDCGVPVLWQCEKDIACQSVLMRHFGVPIFDSVQEVTRQSARPVDLVCGGSPCQSFSVAGGRTGLDGESGLWYEFHRVLTELKPRYFLWENVPGVLSSGAVDPASGKRRKGLDFAIVLAGFTGVVPTIPHGGWRGSGLANGWFYNVAWRILDTQHTGVPQRRRRVFVVGCLAGCGVSPAEILFNFTRSAWHPAPGKAARQGASAAASKSAPQNHLAQHPGYSPHERSPLSLDLSAEMNSGVVTAECGGNNTSGAIDVATALNAHGGTGRLDFESETFLVSGFSQYERSDADASLRSSGGDAGYGSETLIAGTLGAEHGRNRGLGNENETDFLVVADPTAFSWQAGAASDISLGRVTPTLGAIRKSHAVQHDSFGVRRLTPLECERLQDFPDDWTRYSADGKELSDSVRYKMMGNAVTVRVIAQIIQRLLKAHRRST